MVEPGRELHAAALGDVDRPPRAHAIGEHRHDHAGSEEQRAAAHAAEAQVRDQSAEGDHRGEELHSGARLGDLEAAGGGVDQHAVQRGGHAACLAQPHR